MIFILAWILVSSSVFLSAFYMSVYGEKKGDMRKEFEAPDSWPSVSILVPAYNEEHVVSESLENLLNMDYNDFKIIFINDASTDSTLEKARQFEDEEKLEIIDLDENRGKAGALNAGLEKADTKYTVVQDADSVIGSGLVQKTVSRMEAEVNTGGVIARIAPLQQDTFVRKLQVVEYMMTNFYRNLLSTVDLLDVTPGAFSIYRTKDLKDVDGFDEGNLTEDLDMAWRLRKKGRSIRMYYGARSRTELPSNFRDLKGQRVRWARGFLYNVRKHSGMFLSKKYGLFSRFHVPMQFLVGIISVLGLGLIGYGLAESLYNFYITVTSVGLKFSLPQVNIVEAILSFQWKVYTPLILGFSLVGYLIREGYRESGRSLDRPHTLGFYFFAFFFLQAYFWSTALFKELFSSTKAWT